MKIAFQFLIPEDDAVYLKTVLPPARAPAVQPSDKVGRGTRKGCKLPLPKLARPLKTKSRRADFVRFVGSKPARASAIMAQFGISRPNVNSFLTALHRDHGIGYKKEGDFVSLLLPAGSNWTNIGL